MALPLTTRPLPKDPGRGKWGCFGALASPPSPPPHIRKFSLGQKVKFIEGAGNLRPMSGTQTVSWPLTRGGGGFLLKQKPAHHKALKESPGIKGLNSKEPSDGGSAHTSHRNRAGD